MMRSFIDIIESASASPADEMIRRSKTMALPSRFSIVPIDATTVEINDLKAPSPGHGQGRVTMRGLLALADELGVTIEVWPVWDEDVDGALYQTDLEDWYGRLGFRYQTNRDETTDGETDRYMVRSPAPVDLRETSLDAPPVPDFFHATTLARWDKIRHEGLVPSTVSRPGKPAAVYLSHQMSMAEHYADMNFGENEAQPWVILRIAGTAISEDKLGPDTDQEMDLNFDDLLARGYTAQQLRAGEFPWWVSLEEIGQCVYLGHIPPDAITLIKTIR